MPNATITAAGMRLMKLLVGNPPRTVSELIRATGVTRTAVTEQLNELAAAGFVERQTQRLTGRGRPRHLYQATGAAMVVLFSNQRLVAPIMWQAIRDLGGPQLCDKILKRISSELARRYNEQITANKPKQRLQQLIRLLTAEGGFADGEEDARGRLVLNKRSCPFYCMADPQRSVCTVDLEMLRAVVGCPVRQTACRLNGDPCCSFEIVEE